jgi:predicted DCC family thiol-disulfide oxidoreductase YuxK
MATRTRAQAALRDMRLHVPHSTALDAKAVLVYDGVCNICNAGVHWLAVRDPSARIAFCALQSESAGPLLAATGLNRASLRQRFAVVEGNPAEMMLAGMDAAGNSPGGQRRPSWMHSTTATGSTAHTAPTEKTSNHGIASKRASRGAFRVHRASTAALRAAELASSGRRGGPSWLLWAAAAGRLVPVSVRDAVYDAVAESRYRVFGRTDACQLPPQNLEHRFLDAIHGERV